MESYLVYWSIVSIVVLNQLTETCVPYFDCTIYRRCSNTSPVRSKLATKNFCLMLSESGGYSSLIDIPQFDAAIVRAAEQ